MIVWDVILRLRRLHSGAQAACFPDATQLAGPARTAAEQVPLDLQTAAVPSLTRRPGACTRKHVSRLEGVSFLFVNLDVGVEVKRESALRFYDPSERGWSCKG